MAKEVRISKSNFPTYLQDWTSGNPCPAEKAFDITEDCPNKTTKDRIYLLFARMVEHGKIAEVVISDGPDIDKGGRVGFFLNKLDIYEKEKKSRNTFPAVAEILGLSVKELRSLIEKLAENA